jgi:hypothetical protein
LSRGNIFSKKKATDFTDCAENKDYYPQITQMDAEKNRRIYKKESHGLHGLLLRRIKNDTGRKKLDSCFRRNDGLKGSCTENPI